MKSTIHIEFYGIPGCGKSTVSAVVAKGLRQEGNIVKEPSWEIDHGISEGKRRTVKLARSIYYIFKNPKQIVKIRKLVRINGYFRKDAILQAVNVIQKLKVYNENRREQIIIWDEGLTQAAISLSVNGNIKSSENEIYMQEMCPKDIKVVRIYIKEDINVVLKRIDERAEGCSRVEREKDPAKRKKMLVRFTEKCEEIKSDLSIYGFGKTTDEISKEIIDFIHPIILT